MVSFHLQESASHFMSSPCSVVCSDAAPAGQHGHERMQGEEC